MKLIKTFVFLFLLTFTTHAFGKSNDLFSNGVSYPKDGDFDNDGVLNYLDAFPTDPLKSIDNDYDGLEDSFEDNDILQFQLNYDKQLTIPMLQNHIK